MNKKSFRAEIGRYYNPETSFKVLDALIDEVLSEGFDIKVIELSPTAELKLRLVTSFSCRRHTDINTYKGFPVVGKNYYDYGLGEIIIKAEREENDMPIKGDKNITYSGVRMGNLIDEWLGFSGESLTRNESKSNIPEIKDVIFHDPATIVLWKDGTKTVVKADQETYDKEKGLAMAIIKKMNGNKGNYNDIFRKWCPYE